MTPTVQFTVKLLDDGTMSMDADRSEVANWCIKHEKKLSIGLHGGDTSWVDRQQAKMNRQAVAEIGAITCPECKPWCETCGGAACICDSVRSDAAVGQSAPIDSVIRDIQPDVVVLPATEVGSQKAL